MTPELLTIVITIISFAMRCTTSLGQYRRLIKTNPSNISNSSAQTKIDPVLREENVHFIGTESNRTRSRCRLLVTTNNFTKISDMEWIAELQSMENVELIPFSDHRIEIICDAADVQWLLRNDDDEIPSQSETIMHDDDDVDIIDRSLERIIDELDSQSELLQTTRRSAVSLNGNHGMTAIDIRTRRSNSELVIGAVTNAMHRLFECINTNFWFGMKLSFLIFLVIIFGFKI